jgi:hypothetical protein
MLMLDVVRAASRPAWSTNVPAITTMRGRLAATSLAASMLMACVTQGAQPAAVAEAAAQSPQLPSMAGGTVNSESTTFETQPVAAGHVARRAPVRQRPGRRGPLKGIGAIGVVGWARRGIRSALKWSARDFTDSAAGRAALVIAPHPDDETLGCGATILRKVSAGSSVTVLIVTDGRHSHRSAHHAGTAYDAAAQRDGCLCRTARPGAGGSAQGRPCGR